MSERHFFTLLKQRWGGGYFLSVGLDSDLDKIPKSAHRYRNGELDISATLVSFNREIVKATRDIVCAYKINSAFYERHGAEGSFALRQSIADIQTIAPGIPVILDAKRGDVENTNKMYTEWAFDHLQADALTVNPYLGKKALAPFLSRAEKGIFVLARTSNPGADKFQDTPTNNKPLYLYIAQQVARSWNTNKNCGLVTGGTQPGEIEHIRKTAGNIPLLIPGIGAQGADIDKVVAAAKDNHGQGMIINSSRSIIFASQESDFTEAARKEAKRINNDIAQA